MKKLFATGVMALFLLAPAAYGQSVLTDLLKGAVNSSSTLGESTTGLLSNLIASVTGSTTTTKDNLIGNWSYTKPSVQFESEDYLSMAGGTAIASKVEDKLATYYKMAGIKSGKLTFNFKQDGTLTYAAGKVTRQGTYTFNDAEKTVTIKTSTGASFKAYVTVYGDEMTLTFEAKKMLELMSTLGNKFNSLKSITSLVKQYTGMKVGFTFARQ